jgi:hypothetical protein
MIVKAIAAVDPQLLYFTPAIVLLALALTMMPFWV